MKLCMNITESIYVITYKTTVQIHMIALVYNYDPVHNYCIKYQICKESVLTNLT